MHEFLNTYSKKKIAILGFGIEGESVVSFLLNRHGNIIVFDNKQEQEFEKGKVRSFQEKGVSFHFGPFPKDFSDFDLIVRSPGVNPQLPELKKAQKDGKVTSPTNIFFDLCPGSIIGITGTKGKGTTASLIYEMLKLQGLDVYLGGNIGVTPIDFLDKLTTQSWVVLELSSFQLLDLHKSPASPIGGPHIAVVLMITSEHLDYHKDTMEYVNAKRNILRFQTSDDFAIINRDYLASNESGIHTEAQVFQVSKERECEQGCFVKDGKIIVRSRNLSSGFRNQSSVVRHPSSETSETEILKTRDILLPGRHNLENVCAAVMAATLAGVSKSNIVKVLRSFKGLEHRLELVATIHGVRYYDDSFSTTPETTIAAIEAFSDPKILILGGSSKGSNFTHLAEVITDPKNNVKAIIGVGVEWPRIKPELRTMNYELKTIEGCKNMKEIAQAAFDAGELGDVVLLSPACASFGMFKNYKDRGEQFKKEVIKLKNIVSQRR